MPGRSRRSALPIAVGLVLALAGYGVIRQTRSGRTGPATVSAPSATVAPAAPEAAPAPPPRTRVVETAKELLRAVDPPPDGAEADRAPDDDPLDERDDPAARAWAAVDMEAARKAMPDSLYWKMAAPTQDPELLREREEERARWNVEYGKVLSNTATAEEIDAYYAHQQLLSTDYLEFVVYTLTNYGDVIPKRDAALLKLAGEMHLARLEEIPRKIAEAHERRAAHDAARRAWLAEQQAFEHGASDAP